MNKVPYEGVPFEIEAPEHVLAAKYGNVGPFKSGLATVVKDGLAFHISLSGEPAYSSRFKRVENFHEGAAVVADETGSFHIDFKARPLYGQRYTQAHSFYEGVAVVVLEKEYFLINRAGIPIHEGSFKYAERMRDGSAIVAGKDGKTYHLNHRGECLYKHSFDWLAGGENGISAASRAGERACKVVSSTGHRLLSSYEAAMEGQV
jgi:hypothetical protein